jgi:hypothetical protein
MNLYALWLAMMFFWLDLVRPRPVELRVIEGGKKPVPHRWSA